MCDSKDELPGAPGPGAGLRTSRYPSKCTSGSAQLCTPDGALAAVPAAGAVRRLQAATRGWLSRRGEHRRPRRSRASATYARKDALALASNAAEHELAIASETAGQEELTPALQTPLPFPGQEAESVAELADGPSSTPWTLAPNAREERSGRMQPSSRVSFAEAYAAFYASDAYRTASANARRAYARAEETAAQPAARRSWQEMRAAFYASAAYRGACELAQQAHLEKRREKAALQIQSASPCRIFRYERTRFAARSGSVYFCK